MIESCLTQLKSLQLLLMHWSSRLHKPEHRLSIHCFNSDLSSTLSQYCVEGQSAEYVHGPFFTLTLFLQRKKWHCLLAHVRSLKHALLSWLPSTHRPTTPKRLVSQYSEDLHPLSNTQLVTFFRRIKNRINFFISKSNFSRF